MPAMIEEMLVSRFQGALCVIMVDVTALRHCFQVAEDIDGEGAHHAGVQGEGAADNKRGISVRVHRVQLQRAAAAV